MTDHTPTQAVESYLTDRRIDDLSDETLERYETVLTGFAHWLETEVDKETINVPPNVVNQYKLSRSGDKATSTLKTELNIIHRFFRYCESNGLVDDLISPRILIPKSSASRDERIDSDTADRVLSYLDRYRYASRDHAMFALAWHTSMRRGALRSLDVEDVRADSREIEVMNRPDEGTRLKNGDRSERWVSINDRVATILSDYISVNRIETTDDYGRRPLFSTKHGRISVDAITDTFYRLTRPCVFGSDCPDNLDIDDCKAAQKTNKARNCPFALSSHPCRRGSITQHLRNDVPKKVVSDRADVTINVLDDHYNKLTEQEKMEQRRVHLNDL